MKYLTSIWTTIILGITLIGVRVADPQILEELRLSIFDQYIQSLPVEHSNDVVLLNIGEESLEQFGQYPWPRQYYAQMISDLRNANAGMIGFTIMFPENDRFGGDEVFASWVKDNGIILAQDADENGRSDYKIRYTVEDVEKKKRGGFLGIWDRKRLPAISIESERSGTSETELEFITLDVSKLTPGNKKLKVWVKDNNSAQIYEVETFCWIEI